jgi:hypothetical protein
MYPIDNLNHPQFKLKDEVTEFEVDRELSTIAIDTSIYLWESLQYLLFAEKEAETNLLKRKHIATLKRYSLRIHELVIDLSDMVEVGNGVDFEVCFKTPVPLSKGFHFCVCLHVDYDEHELSSPLLVTSKDKTDSVTLDVKKVLSAVNAMADSVEDLKKGLNLQAVL